MECIIESQLKPMVCNPDIMNATDLGCWLEVRQDEAVRKKVGITRIYMQKLCPICNSVTPDSFEHESTVPEGWLCQEVDKVKLCLECDFIWYDSDTTHADYAVYSGRGWINQFTSALTAGIR